MSQGAPDAADREAGDLDDFGFYLLLFAYWASLRRLASAIGFRRGKTQNPRLGGSLNGVTMLVSWQTFAIWVGLALVHSFFWLWVYFRLGSSPVARRIWENTWVRWTAWQDPKWVLVFALGSFAFIALVIFAAFFPESHR